ncbi:MAG: hypothetical protein SPL83_06045 [Succinivibrio sp.]|jgi:hypothetical protein|uniref:hypothetical protein n=1 Tax=Succinivibrio sp. TaxID=2053619 RepID=UPI00205371E0|nr:hypothetical protein [Succinivibrio sp.]MDY6246791.1 hypothetical protein [Succinivibrio sp.]DAP31178.1 MAG TPA: hypothetical protein [Caudoviricetes sp.]DAU00831.1 MAG TPA: hypothetical protein [Caudoviricetes sp.]
MKRRNLKDPVFTQTLIDELGGPTKVGMICGIKAPSVLGWLKKGIPRGWMMYFKTEYPNLQVWAKEPDWNKEPSTLSK